MNVILSEDVPNVGQTGETVTVADGFARNFLLPRKMAVQVHSGKAKQIEHERRLIRVREDKRRAQSAEKAEALEALTLDFQVRTGADEKLFGSVTTGQIAERLAEMGFPVDRKVVSLEEPIRSLGIYVATVRLGGGIEASVKVWVSGLEDEPAVEEVPAEAEKEAP